MEQIVPLNERLLPILIHFMAVLGPVQNLPTQGVNCVIWGGFCETTGIDNGSVLCFRDCFENLVGAFAPVGFCGNGMCLVGDWGVLCDLCKGMFLGGAGVFCGVVVGFGGDSI